MEHIVIREQINGYSKLHFYTERNQIDFKSQSIVVRIIIDDPQNSNFDENLEVFIAEKNQKNTNCFDIDIPLNSNSSKKSFRSNLITINISDIKVKPI